ncbi:hypothetical protein KM043_017248 [Ampulex compressa]|nr:hypothetical protein KM043_017248 [Ampulex compressa]
MKKTPKISALVVSAIRNLREVSGSTSKEIMNYIMSQCNTPEPTAQRQTQAALKRGLNYGILKRVRGHYTLNTEPYVQQAVKTLSPVERSRRRRGRRKGRSRRRGRGKRRRSRRGRRGRRRGRGRSRARRRSARSRMASVRCRCSSRKPKDMDVLRKSPVEQQKQEDLPHEKEQDTMPRKRSKSREDRSPTRSRSSISSGREDSEERREDLSSG